MEVDRWCVVMGGWGWGGVVKGVIGWVIKAMACEGNVREGDYAGKSSRASEALQLIMFFGRSLRNLHKKYFYMKLYFQFLI